MFLNMKRRISELMDTILEYIEVLPGLSKPDTAVLDCLNAIGAIQNQLQMEERVPFKTLDQLEIVKISFDEILNNHISINENTFELMHNKVVLLKEIFQEEINAKLNVVFFPYKASMWDSLASIYEAASKDENCVARVVPIPYYQLTQNEAIHTYEGEFFPDDIPIVHYSNYVLEDEQPDIIFVHNVYDQYNTITRVYEQYFTTNLKQYTDMLVYVPYHVSSFIPPTQGTKSLAYNLPTIENIDKIILVADFLKDSAIRDGVPSEKLLVLGSPKLDAMVNALKEDIAYPSEWKEKIEGKTVYLINTGCLFFASQPFLKLEKLVDFFNIARIAEDSVIIWRPHPLTLVSIMKYVPSFAEYYVNLTEKYIKGGDKFYNKIIIDETADYMPALKAADVLISADGSLLRSYLLTEKKVLYWDDRLYWDESLPTESLLPEDVFYYAFNPDEPWFEVVKKFAKGYDPLAENRKGMASKVYVNTDGTSGEKIYHVIKECVLKRK
ncbi:hypothetical protein [Brevibacillus sp. 179-C9.3 HS]|uniref:hypothetical protein n=1 Tax=unclassified Brevibacillus TaxID=2684853 RepID=UPI00399F8AEF